MKLLVGTSKGLLVWEKTTAGWKVKTVQFEGMPVSLVYQDPRNKAWWIVLAHRHWGHKIQVSFDEGITWERRPTPQYPEGTKLVSGKPATLKKIWIIEQGGSDRPNELWMGTEPGGLFHSSDYGQTFQLVKGLWDHPSRIDENQWFGAGRDHPFLHSIVVDPRDSQHVYIAVSCAGVFETTNGGQDWTPRNTGLVAAYLPNPDVEVGHDPHRMLVCQDHPDVLWQQNHCGVFVSRDGAKTWKQVSREGELVHYGFALAIDDRDPKKAWVIPAISDEKRIAVDLALTVCRTTDGGQSWQAQRNGLPQENCFDIAFRHAFHKMAHTLAFGTTTGNLYLSEDEGDHWTNLSHTLARVESVVFAT
ncbi:MAG: glycosyl hydrolase [Bacteroidota bacterium]